MPNRAIYLIALLVLPLALRARSASGAVPEKISYNRHVRPILSNNCFYCHGPDEKHREADLRLDVRGGATTDLGGHAAVVPGRPTESMLLARVTSRDDDERMPPPQSKKPLLSAEQVEILRRWIEQGAEYDGHWAFLPLTTATRPEVKVGTWPRNAIDRFILARLEAEGIAPSPEADRATLIRRVSLDLAGLLPTPEEVAAFVSDADPRAYERLVERLLASPHYGERWGRHWLDQARYADSNGYSIDSERGMWPYRDWVIKALNSDLPFDQFTIEQLAGDLLPSPTKSQLVATGFHRNTLINEEGGTDREQFRHEAVVDRVNTTGAVWLALTIGCAQCHTHKFDPLLHREYYELFAFFNGASDVNNKGATLSVSRGELFGGSTVAPLPTPTPDVELAKRKAAWEQMRLAELEAPSAEPVAWSPVKYVEYHKKGGGGFKLLDDNSLLSEESADPHDIYRVTVTTDNEQVAAMRLRVLTHDSLPKHGPGTASNGNFVLTDFSLSVDGEEVPLSTAFADHEQPSFPVIGALDDDPKSGWAINVGPGSKAKMNANHEAVFVLAKPLAASGKTFEVKLHHDLNAGYLVGRFALDIAATAPTKPTEPNPALLEALRVAADKRNAEQNKLVQAAFEQADPVARTAKAKKEKLPADVAEVMVMKELDKPRETYVALRGDFLRPDKNVGRLKPGVPRAIPPALPESESRSRLDLAKWLVNAENPLSPRVAVNRVWMRYFGRGLVETDEDFGSQGAAPTHPELLDWLAAEFIRGGWSMKELHRLIVMSATYRQSSKARPDLAEQDPRNLLLARQERVRFEAEVVRDAALSASGLLNATIGGPSVRPPQPDGVYAFTQAAKPWTAETGANRYRRAMYTTFFRSAPYPLFSTFDAPDFQSVCTRRGRSNSPLQALTVANDEAFLEFAQGLAARVLRETPGDSESRLRHMFALCLCRKPMARELELLHGYYTRQAADLATDAKRAEMLLSPELKKNGSPTVAAALVCAARAVLNTDGFITRE